MNFPAFAGFILVFFSIILMIGLSVLKDRVKASFRDIPAFAKFSKALGTAVEDGSRVHFSLGSASLIEPRTAASFAALNTLSRSVELSASSDMPPLSTSGDAGLTILAQDALRTAYEAAGAVDQYQSSMGRLSGVTPFSYAAGTLSSIYDEDISANIIAGGFGSEIALLIDATERESSFTLAAADSLSGQAVVYASAPDLLLGEELFVPGTYFNLSRMHLVSPYVQDILRWLIVAALIGGAAMKLLAGLV